MSPQLTISSLFSVLALAGLCVVTGVRDLAGAELAAKQPLVFGQALFEQAGLEPGLLDT